MSNYLRKRSYKAQPVCPLSGFVECFSLIV